MKRKGGGGNSYIIINDTKMIIKKYKINLSLIQDLVVFVWGIYMLCCLQEVVARLFVLWKDLERETNVEIGQEGIDGRFLRG